MLIPVATFTDVQYTTINQSTAGRFDSRVFVNCLHIYAVYMRTTVDACTHQWIQGLGYCPDCVAAPQSYSVTWYVYTCLLLTQPWWQPKLSINTGEGGMVQTESCCHYDG